MGVQAFFQDVRVSEFKGFRGFRDFGVSGLGFRDLEI